MEAPVPRVWFAYYPCHFGRMGTYWALGIDANPRSSTVLSNSPSLSD